MNRVKERLDVIYVAQKEIKNSLATKLPKCDGRIGLSHKFNI